VEHPIYGQITAPLRLSSRYEVEQFIHRCREEAAAPLSLLTDGVHLHTVCCQDPACEERVRGKLKELGMLLEG
jgi:transcriptional regulator of NAD metabolism